MNITPRLVVEEDGGKLVVTAGTVEQLIWCLADRDIPDAAYCDEFFYSMSYFTKGPDLMSHLRHRYEYLPPEDASTEAIADYDKWRPVIQERVLKMMKYLLENHWYHIERDEEIIWAIKEFVESPVVKSTRVAKSLKELVNNRLEGMLKRTGRTASIPPPTSTNSTSTTATATTTTPTTLPTSSSTNSLSASANSATTDKSGDNAGGSTDLASHGRSSSSPIIVWRARRDTMTTDSPQVCHWPVPLESCESKAFRKIGLFSGGRSSEAVSGPEYKKTGHIDTCCGFLLTLLL